MQVDEDGDMIVPRRQVGPCAAHPPPLQHPPSRQSLPLPAPHTEAVEVAEDVVLSEVHMDCLRPPGSQADALDVTTVFTTAAGEAVASIQHSMATPLSRVGLQVWRGALLLADYLLHQGAAAFQGALALELGAGPGLAGLVLARLAATAVYLTDVGADILANCQRNAEEHLRCHRPLVPGTSMAAVHVRKLDWVDPPDWLLPPPQQQQVEQQSKSGADPLPPAGAAATAAWHSPPCPASSSFKWQPEDREQLKHLHYLLAADCVYDHGLTEAFMRSALLLMRYTKQHSGRSPRLLVSLERRVVFTLTDMAARAPAYDYWRTLFEAVEREPAVVGEALQQESAPLMEVPVLSGCREPASVAGVEAGGAAVSRSGCSGADSSGGTGSSLQAAMGGQLPLVGWRVGAGSIPQAVQQYQRSNEYLELWVLTLRGG